MFSEVLGPSGGQEIIVNVFKYTYFRRKPSEIELRSMESSHPEGAKTPGYFRLLPAMTGPERSAPPARLGLTRQTAKYFLVEFSKIAESESTRSNSARTAVRSGKGV